MMYSPLPLDVTLKESKIHGLGLFAAQFIPKDTNLGISHYFFENKIIRTPLGGFYNHSERPNCYAKLVYPRTRAKRACLTVYKDIEIGEEITVFYKIAPFK